MSSQNPRPRRGWCYANEGDYHRNLDLDWSFAPTYLRKTALVSAFIERLDPKSTILDVGSGEGVFVERYRAMGYQIFGVDFNYESAEVIPGDVLRLPFKTASFDTVLFLDTLEHLSHIDQPVALSEIRRIMRPNGRLLCSVPNLAHLNSRLRMLFRGQLDRADAAHDHLGERPYLENRELLSQAGFKISAAQGVTLTPPFVYRSLICRRPKALRWLHDLFEPIARRRPQLSLLTVFECVVAD